MKKSFLSKLCIIVAALSMSVIPAQSENFLKTVGNLLNNGTKIVNQGKEVVNKGKKIISKRPIDDGKLRVFSDIEGLQLKVISCSADDNDDVFIVFTLENQNNYDAECSFRESTASDDEGYIYDGAAIRFALANEQFKENCVAKLHSGVPIKYKMRIRNVDPVASMLKKVNISFYELPIGSMTGSISIVNVPITRPGDK